MPISATVTCPKCNAAVGLSLFGGTSLVWDPDWDEDEDTDPDIQPTAKKQPTN